MWVHARADQGHDQEAWGKLEASRGKERSEYNLFQDKENNWFRGLIAGVDTSLLVRQYQECLKL